jgi:hypothetical protein
MTTQFSLSQSARFTAGLLAYCEKRRVAIFGFGVRRQCAFRTDAARKSNLKRSRMGDLEPFYNVPVHR